jgi:hypothetical protein
MSTVEGRKKKHHSVAVPQSVQKSIEHLLEVGDVYQLIEILHSKLVDPSRRERETTEEDIYSMGTMQRCELIELHRKHCPKSLVWASSSQWQLASHKNNSMSTFLIVFILKRLLTPLFHLFCLKRKHERQLKCNTK